MYKKKGTKNLVLSKPKIINLLNYNYLLMVDVETCNFDRIIMDFSYLIINLKTGMIVESGAYLIKEAWDTLKFRNGCFMKLKHKKYASRKRKKEIEVITKQHLYNKLNKIIKDYNIELFCAYNGAFDLDAIINTFDYVDKRTKYWKEPCWRTNSLRPKFLKLDLLDLWTYASVIFGSDEYKKWYDENIHRYTKQGERKTSVEYVVKYLKENNHFKETHIGIEDLENEYNIFIASVWSSPNKEVVINYSGNCGVRLLAQDKPLDKKGKLYKIIVQHDLS